MEKQNPGDDQIAGEEAIAEGADLQVTMLTLDRGQSVPWHLHSTITDQFVCLEGCLVVETRSAKGTYKLAVGERCTVGPGVQHLVHVEDYGPCRLLVIQGVGLYDQVPAKAQHWALRRLAAKSQKQCFT